MMGLVLEFEDPASLCCQICAGIQRAKSLIGDLTTEKRRNRQIVQAASAHYYLETTAVPLIVYILSTKDDLIMFFY